MLKGKLDTLMKDFNKDDMDTSSSSESEDGEKPVFLLS